MNNALDLATLGILAERVHIDAATKLYDLTGLVLYDLVATDNIGATQAHFLARHQALEAGRRHFLEIAAIDIKFVAERYLPLTHIGFRVAWQAEHFRSVLRVVGQCY